MAKLQKLVTRLQRLCIVLLLPLCLSKLFSNEALSTTPPLLPSIVRTSYMTVDYSSMANVFGFKPYP